MKHIIIFLIFFILKFSVGLNNNTSSYTRCSPKIPCLQGKPTASKTSESTSHCDLNIILEDFSRNTKPPSDFYLKGNKVAEQIFEILQRNRNDVDRYVIAGSVGKGTAINNGSDFDMVVFLKDLILPLHRRVIEELIATLNKHSHKLDNYQFRRTTEMLIKIRVSNIKFDLVPTVSYKRANSSQFKEVSLRIERLPNPLAYCYLYNGGLSEAAVQFGKRQSEFTHSVIRLAKYWNEKIHINEYVNGRSFRMELIAIKSCEGVPENNIYLAFKKFLNMLIDFEHMLIIFEENYRKSDIPAHILHYRGPIVLDPVNYYSNLVHHWNIPKSAVLKYKINAKISLQELEYWKSNPCDNTKSFENIFIKDFVPEFLKVNNLNDNKYLLENSTDCKTKYSLNEYHAGNAGN